MVSSYDPPRRNPPSATGDDPLEVELVYTVRTCGSCSFFWPTDPATQPYGPYSTYDFPSNTPALASPPADAASFAWLTGVTRPPAFPDAEIMDGCRKAPIMTLGINPNLTAFLPGQTGTSWCYPSFSSAGGADSWTKYAYYYRYRSVFQERFDFTFASQFIVEESRVVAAKAGEVVAANRASDAPAYSIDVRYDGDSDVTTIPLPGVLGAPPYGLLVDVGGRFNAGDVIAGQIAVPAGRSVEIYDQQVGYYERMVPILGLFSSFLAANGHAGASLRVGEDVGQLDMVACASPHWTPAWLGGSTASEQTIIRNCVSQNAWAIKQLIQTRPAVLLLIGEASYTMFAEAFGARITAAQPLPEAPADGAFTLLRATTDPQNPVTFAFETTIEGAPYRLSTRIIVAPHFSYVENFVPQYRFSPTAWAAFQGQYAACAHFLMTDPRIAKPAQEGGYRAFLISSDVSAVRAQLAQSWPATAATLAGVFYDPNAMIEAVFEALYQNGTLAYADGVGGAPGHLARSDGPCSFCVNAHWSFPAGCPYDKPPKPGDPPLPDRFLQQVAAELIASRPGPARFASMRLLDDSYEARREPPGP
jgi:hypothetical protein